MKYICLGKGFPRRFDLDVCEGCKALEAERDALKREVKVLRTALKCIEEFMSHCGRVDGAESIRIYAHDALQIAAEKP